MKKWFVLGLILAIIVFILIKKRSELLILIKSFFGSKIGKESHENLYHFDLISRYYRNIIKQKQFFHSINDSTVKDLDLNDIFIRIDHTTSKIGQQYLYAKLRTITTKKELENFNRIVDLFENERESALICKKHLSRLTDENGYYFEELIFGTPLYCKNVKLAQILTIAFVLCLGFGFIFPLFFLFLLPIFITNLILYYSNKPNVDYYLVALSELSKTLYVSKKILKEDAIEVNYQNTTFLNDISVILNKFQYISLGNLQNPEVTYPLIFLFELIKIAFNIELLSLNNVVNSLNDKRSSIEKLFNIIGEIDAAISVAKLREEEIICKPVFTNSKLIAIDDIVHPLIDGCVTNSIFLENKSLLLTGSNMSGKTTFIRAVSINSILAQTIYTVFAKKYEAPFLKVFTSIRISDSLEEKASYYLEEVLTIKKFIDVAGDTQPCLFVLDEILKGTNTLERIAAGGAILKYLNTNNNIILVSTHDIELTELLEHNDYALYHFCEEINNDILAFNYQLRAGILKTKNAIKILELYSYPKEVINEALSIQEILIS